jgi:predicted acetyltransferase
MTLNPTLHKTTLADYPTIQNMARFYVYDRSPYMGWECPETGLFECIDFKHYFENTNHHAYLIRVNNELAGFVLLDKEKILEDVDWNIGEFFILAKFQSHGVGNHIAKEIFNKFPGKWSVAVMPENKSAVKFWRKIIHGVSNGKFNEVLKTAEELSAPENAEAYSMIIFTLTI